MVANKGTVFQRGLNTANELFIVRPRPLKWGVPPRCITFRQGLYTAFYRRPPSRFTTHLYFVSKEGSALNASPLSFNSVPKQYLRFVQNIKSRKTRPLNSVAICDGILGEGALFWASLHSGELNNVAFFFHLRQNTMLLQNLVDKHSSLLRPLSVN